MLSNARLVELTRLSAGTRRREARERGRRGAADPDILVTPASSSLGGVQETVHRVRRGGEVQVCEGCGEEFCHGGCATSDYSHQERRERREVQAGRKGGGKSSKGKRKSKSKRALK